MTEIFDRSRLDALRQRAASRPDWDTPEVLRVEGDADRSDQRAWMARALALLPEPGRSELRTRLTSENQFHDSYHELAVASILQNAGCTIAYEPDVGSVTPDLFVEHPDLERPAIVEIWTRNRSEPAKRAARRWNDLAHRITAIPVPLGLLLQDAPPGSVGGPEAGQAKRIVEHLKSWLLRPSTTLGSATTIEGFTFCIVTRLPGLRARFASPAGGGWVDSWGVISALKVKVRTYATYATERESFPSS